MVERIGEDCMSMVVKLRQTLFLILFLITVFASIGAQENQDKKNVEPSSDGISLAPTRFELDMLPGTDTTVVVNLNYRSANSSAPPSRIVASLNDWTIGSDGQIIFSKANTLKDSASPWIVYSPASMTVMPGNIHSIRVTISVPKDATPGDHLSALIVEPRPDNLKLDKNQRQVVVRYRMAAVFYIKVPKLTRIGTLQNLKASINAEGIVITPTLKNEGNSVVRPIASAKVIDADGRTVAELSDAETLPILAGCEFSSPIVIPKLLSPGKYTVRFKVDFQGGGKLTEGVTELVVKEESKEKAASHEKSKDQ
jgi:hypothetical protein